MTTKSIIVDASKQGNLIPIWVVGLLFAIALILGLLLFAEGSLYKLSARATIAMVALFLLAFGLSASVGIFDYHVNKKQKTYVLEQAKQYITPGTFEIIGSGEDYEIRAEDGEIKAVLRIVVKDRDSGTYYLDIIQ